MTVDLVHQLITHRASRTPDAPALSCNGQQLSYAELSRHVESAASALLALSIGRGERVGIYLEKRPEAVTAMFGAAAAGAVFVPINPLLRADQVAHIASDCNIRILVTSADRLDMLAHLLPDCRDLHTVIIVDSADTLPAMPGVHITRWESMLSDAAPAMAHRCIDSDMAAILYTSGSTGKPKGVVLSHRNLVAGARSVAGYLENTPDDRILCVLPLSFDYGLSQLTTAFHSGACAVLMNHLLPRDVIKTVERERITGLAAVPPLWIQLAQLHWPKETSLRYITSSGGAMPRPTLELLRKQLASTKIYLMYGLTEAFRSTYLPPAELDRRPDSIGRAIPNAEILVLREDGTPCAANEPGELVHRGALVSLGYWNRPEQTAERYRPIPTQHGGIPEVAVWSGDTVRMDEEGFLYYIGRKDDMIKVSGYRVSPTEVEEVIHATGMATEVAAVGVPHPVLGQAIAAFVVPSQAGNVAPQTIIQECKRRLPTYMVPAHVALHAAPLPRNPNGKIDRKSLQHSCAGLFD